jgi:glycosyltransferase involved in cell wall biosynthesis
MRYAWDLQHQYLHESGLDQRWRGWIARYFLHKLRAWDFRSAYGVDHLLCNSNFIARRIAKTYKRDATVLYPPIELQQFIPGHQKDNFYLAASRLVPYKKMDLIVETFANLPDKQLIIIGDGPDAEKIRQKASANVLFLGYQDNAVLIDHLQRAKALIFAAEEDFGLIPLEAQACGTPVIAYGKGGALETVRGLDQENPTGLFFEKQTVDSIQTAITDFEKNSHKFTQENCINHAHRFHPEQFKHALLQFIHSKMR